MTLENISICPVCKGDKLIGLFSCTDFTYSEQQFEIRECTNCHLRITTPRPTIDSISSFYKSDQYISHSTDPKDIFARLYFIARKIALKKKRKLIQKYNKSGAILDFGCGTGSFLSYMQKKNWQTFGVEPSDIARHISIKSGLKVDTDIKKLPPIQFDAITLWHVIEHLHNPNDILHEIKERIKPNGTLFIAVPNFDSLDSKKYNTHWAAYDVPRHLWHFNQKNMSQLLVNHGFTVKKIYPMKMDSYYVSLVSEKYKYPNSLKLFQIIRAVINGFKSNIYAYFTTNYSSLIYVAKRHE